MMNDKDTAFVFEVCPEEALSWEQHNEILKALNQAFSHRTKSFIKKTYAHVEPIMRILCRFNGVLVGHTAIFEIEVIVNNEKIKAGGIGMTLSLKPFEHLGYLLRQKAAMICSEQGYPFAIGRIKNSERVKKDITSLVTCFLDMPLIGKNTRSHDWEILAIYKTNYNQLHIENFIDSFKKSGFIQIVGEVF